MAKNNGFIDLGTKYGGGIEAKPAQNVSYPTMFVTHKTDGKSSSLDELPDGEFEFTAKGRILSYKEDMKNGTCSCEIEVMAIKPTTSKAKKAKPADEGLDEALTKISKKKSEKY